MVDLLAELVDQAQLEQLIDHLENIVLCEEVVMLLANPSVNAVESQPCLCLSQLSGDELAQLFSLIFDRDNIVIGSRLHQIQESLLLQL